MRKLSDIYWESTLIGLVVAAITVLIAVITGYHPNAIEFLSLCGIGYIVNRLYDTKLNPIQGALIIILLCIGYIAYKL